MKLILENWRKYLLKEEVEIFSDESGKILLWPDFSQGHVTRGHTKPGQGSIFAMKEISQIADLIRQNQTELLRKLDPNGGKYKHVYPIAVPNVGYDLVIPMSDAQQIVKAGQGELTTTEKEEREASVTVPALKTTKKITDFPANTLSVVARPTAAEYLAVKTPEMEQAAKEGRVYTILSAWPGRPDVPESSKWGGKWVVVIPQGEL